MPELEFLERDYNTQYFDLVDLVHSGGYPDKILLHPDSFHDARQQVRAGSMGCDEEGEFFWVGKTRFRPSYSRIRKRRNFLDISKTSIKKWLKENRK